MGALTTAAVTVLVKSLLNKSLEGAFDNLGSKVSDKALTWFKSLFYKDEKPKSVLKKLQDNPNEKENIAVIKALIENAIEDDNSKEIYLNEILSNLPQTTSIQNYKNTNTGTINSGGGSVQIGNNYGK